jgi:hypothetical protein
MRNNGDFDIGWPSVSDEIATDIEARYEIEVKLPELGAEAGDQDLI